MIIYGGSPTQIRHQHICRHDWAGPCIDSIGRYYKCKICFCLDREETEQQSVQFEKNILEDIKHCEHVMAFVSSSHFIGEGETGKDEIRICIKCGLLIVDGERNFHTYHLSIRIMTRAHLEAIERFIKLIESEA